MTQETQSLISFIVPVYNEEHNIAHMLGNLHRVTQANPQWNSEVIIIVTRCFGTSSNVIAWQP